MTPPPYLTADAKWAVERLLTEIGWQRAGQLTWVAGPDAEVLTNLADVFNSPWVADPPKPGNAP